MSENHLTPEVDPGQFAVPEPGTSRLLCTLWWDAGLRHQGAGQVPHFVESERRQPCPAQSPAEDVAQQRVRFDRTARALLVRLAREHESAHRPARELPALELRDKVRRHGDSTHAFLSLRHIILAALLALEVN
jgi:hypothetical protein